MKHARPDYNRIQDPAGKIPADEPVFLLRGQDKAARAAVLAWADEHDRLGGDQELSRLARSHAAKMEGWAKKVADMPPKWTELPDTALVALALARAPGFPSLPELYDQHGVESVSDLARAVSSTPGNDVSTVEHIDGVMVLATTTMCADRHALRTLGTALESLMGPCVVFLTGPANQYTPLCAVVSKSITGRLKAYAMMASVASRGGGKEGLAIGESTTGDVGKIISDAREYVAQRFRVHVRTYVDLRSGATLQAGYRVQG